MKWLRAVALQCDRRRLITPLVPPCLPLFMSGHIKGSIVNTINLVFGVGTNKTRFPTVQGGYDEMTTGRHWSLKDMFRFVDPSALYNYHSAHGHLLRGQCLMKQYLCRD